MNKKKKYFLGLLIATLCFLFTACSDLTNLRTNDNDVLPPLTGSVGFTDMKVNAKVGDILTASTPNLGGSGEISYIWQRGSTIDGGFNTIPGVTGNTYTFVNADTGYFIRFAVSRENNSGTIFGTYPTAILPTGTPDLGGVVSFAGDFIVGKTITVDITALVGGTGNTYYQWMRETAFGSNSYTPISNVTGNNYTLSQADEGRRIYVRVTREGYADSRRTPNSPVIISEVILPPLTGSVGFTDMKVNAKVGDILTAGTSNLGGSGDISYIWQRGSTIDGGFTTIPGATGNIYTFVNADAGNFIRLVVSRGNNSGTLFVTYPTTILPASTPDLGGSVSFSGDFIVGGTIIVDITALVGGAGISYYQWMRETASGSNSYTPIPNVTGNSYTLTQADEGRRIYVRVTREGYADSRRTPNSPVIIDESTLPPLTGSVGFTDTKRNAKVGDTLTAGTPNLGGSGEISYIWQRGSTQDGSFYAIPGATGITYTLVDADVGNFIRFVVRRENNSGTLFGNYPTAILPASTPDLGGSVSLTGNFMVGQIVTVDISLLTGQSWITYYQWMRETASGSNSYSQISGITGNSYTLTEADEGRRILVHVTKEGHSDSRTTPASPPVVAEIFLPPLTGDVWIDVRTNAKVGDTMIVDTKSIGGSGDISYIWQRGSTQDGSFFAIPGATGITYTLVDADAGNFIRLVVSRENNSETLFDTYPTAILLASAPELGGSVSLIGDSNVGGTIIVDITGLTGEAGATYYQWMRDIPGIIGFEIITEATGNIYTLTQADEGRRIYVYVTREGHADSLRTLPITVAP